MVRCQAFCVSGLRCKKSAPDDIGFCYTHNPDNIIYCCKCKNKISNNKKCILGNCIHKFCMDCISMDIYNFQWFDDFSTDHPLRCPKCDVEVSDNNWQNIMDYLVKKEVLKRKINKTAYLSKYQYNCISHLIILGKEFKCNHHKTLDDVKKICKDIIYLPNKVYFVKSINYNSGLYGCQQTDETRYFFDIDYDLLKKENKEFYKCFIEYFFNPKRVERFGIEWLDSN